MASNQKFDFVISGAGLVGCLVASQLSNLGLKCCLIEKNKIKKGPRGGCQSDRVAVACWLEADRARRGVRGAAALHAGRHRLKQRQPGLALQVPGVLAADLPRGVCTRHSRSCTPV